MFGFFKKKEPKEKTETVETTKAVETAESVEEPPAQPEESAPEPNEPPVPTKAGMFQRLKSGLSKTKARLSTGLETLVLGEKTIDADLLEDIETQLLTADIGIEATQYIIEQLTAQIERKALKDPEALLSHLKEVMTEMLLPCQTEWTVDSDAQPKVILMVGINGAGKTTTIGKLAHRFQSENHDILLAAGDTFRAAAIEQLQAWGERNQVPVIAQSSGSDSASVIFDALQSAKARQTDILIADTAGRLHTQSHLMEELKKISRVLKKIDESAPHEVLLVLDANLGQNAIRQLEEFHEAVGVTGIVLTKLDGTAKGGVIFSLAHRFNIPIRFVGVGEGIEDLQTFDAKAFVEALF